VLGVTLVLADGTIANAGGKVVKNVAGYDLGKLVCGSRGTLALIGRVSLRLHPIPAAARTLLVPTDDPARLVTALLRSQLQPSALDVLHPGRVAVLFEGGAAGVAEQLLRAQALVGGEEADDAPWLEVRERQATARGRVRFAPGGLRETLAGLGEAIVRPAAARLDGTVSLSRTVVEHFDRCLGCMACVSSCPSGVRYDRLIEATRDTVEREFARSPGERLVRSLLFQVLPYPKRMSLALRLAGPGRRLPLPGPLRPLVEIAPPWRSTERPPGITRAAGETRARVGLLTGCVQSAVFGDVNAATARVLAADGFEVVTPPQGCCGALSVHAGRLEEGRSFARTLIEAFDASDVDLVVVNASGCGSHLKELGWLLEDDPSWAERAAAFSSKVKDVGELLHDVEPRATRRPLPLSVAFQDSCHLRHAQRLPLASRASLARIPGLELVEPAEQDLCCGSAGIYNVVQAEAARELGERKARHVLATGAQVLTSANPGCLVQLATTLRRLRQPLPALHPIELVDASIRGVPAGKLRATARR
jgi:glycolate oxidase iron-sulfur subunit